MKFKECKGKNGVEEVSSRSTPVPVLVVIEYGQGRAYQRVRRACHHRRLVRACMKHWVLASVSADGAISRIRRHFLARV
jgi:hypothetical protein